MLFSAEVFCLCGSKRRSEPDSRTVTQQNQADILATGNVVVGGEDAPTRACFELRIGSGKCDDGDGHLYNMLDAFSSERCARAWTTKQVTTLLITPGASL